MSDYDLIIRNGTVYDGSGSAPFAADVAIRDGRIAAVEAGEVLLSPSVSIAFRLLAEWFEENGGGDLEELARSARKRRKAP